MSDSATNQGGLSLSVMIVWAIFSWLLQFGWFLIRAFLGVSIVWGLLNAIDPFPVEPIHTLHQSIQNADAEFLGSTLMIWAANQWMPLSILAIFWNSFRSKRAIRRAELTSEHAAYGVSALISYLSISISTPSLERLKKSIDRPRYVRAIIAEKTLSWFTRLFGGVPFLPDDVFAERDDEIVHLKDDIANWLERP